MRISMETAHGHSKVDHGRRKSIADTGSQIIIIGILPENGNDPASHGRFHSDFSDPEWRFPLWAHHAERESNVDFIPSEAIPAHPVLRADQENREHQEAHQEAHQEDRIRARPDLRLHPWPASAVGDSPSGPVPADWGH